MVWGMYGVCMAMGASSAQPGPVWCGVVCRSPKIIIIVIIIIIIMVIVVVIVIIVIIIGQVCRSPLCLQGAAARVHCYSLPAMRMSAQARECATAPHVCPRVCLAAPQVLLQISQAIRQEQYATQRCSPQCC